MLGSIFAETSRNGFTHGLNVILVAGAVVAYACAVLSFVLIRRRDLVPPPVRPPGAQPAVPARPADDPEPAG